MEESRPSRRLPPRPESSTSSHTRMTPSSNNSSTVHLPRTQSSLAVRTASGGASLLQERIRERKGEARQHGRRRSVDLTERAIQSSPVRGPKEREDRRPSSSGISAQKGLGTSMGVKQIEEQVSTLHKQNFDLKLAVFQCRRKNEDLETKLEKQLEEQKELQDVNEQLLTELEKRDQAVEEAVGIICQLEDEVERLKKEMEGFRTFDGQYGGDYFQGSHEAGPPSSPPEFKEERGRPSRLPKMPSFLSENSEGAEALRSLYLPYPSNSEATLPKLQEHEEERNDEMDSPRLSLLSESSFISVYGDKHLSLDGPVEEDELPRHNNSSAVEKWVEERPVDAVTPSRPTPPLRKNQYLSINDVVASPLQRLEKLKVNLERVSRNASITRQLDRPVVKDKAKSKELRRVFTDQSSFEHQQTLPPTPDTISTGTLRHYQASTETLHQDSPPRDSATSRDTAYIRPRSAGETITSRREGHGWDTPSQETLTSYLSHGAESADETGHDAYSTQVQPFAHKTPKRIMTPNLFNFSGGGNEWGKDVMYNRESTLPMNARYSHLRRSSVTDNPNSDDVVTSYANALTRYQDPSMLYGTSPIDTTPKPEIGNRRSSLTAVEKLRKKRVDRELSQTFTHNSSQESPAVSIHSAKATIGSPSVVATPSKKSRMSSLRLFGRSETSPSIMRTETKEVERAEDKERDFRASTPPPIRRNRPTNYAARPSSAGNGAAPRRQAQRDFDLENRADTKQVVRRERKGSITGQMIHDLEIEEGSSGKRKWFLPGISVGRTASVRR